MKDETIGGGCALGFGCIVLIVILSNVVFWGAIIYVAYHFTTKFW